MYFPERVEKLNELESLNRDWDTLKLAIRPECRDDLMIEKAKIAFSVNLFDSSINYFWNMVINDLYKKIIYYGVDYFAAAINWDGEKLRNEVDLRQVKDYQIISGSYSLGITSHEAFFYLNQCREIRNNFSTAHYPIGELDKIEATNFIKNCVKYVLTFDPPAPGMQIKDLIEAMKLEQWQEVEEFNGLLIGQSPQIYPPILHNFFSNFTKSDCELNLKHNIKIAAPVVWEMVDDEARTAVAMRYASLKDRPTKDTAAEAFEFLKIVKGIKYIPETFRDIIFRKHSKNLIDAHMGGNNFYNEPQHAQELLSLGTEDIPLSSVMLYVKALLLSFIGNRYGISWDAQPFNEIMIKNLSQSGIRSLFKLLKDDLVVIAELTNQSPVTRLKQLMELIKDKTMFADQKKDFDYYTKHLENMLVKYFREIYWEKVGK
jgi:hypothetical protein